MRILLIDNGTSYLNELRSLLKDEETKVIGWKDIRTEDTDQAEAIILSGGHDFPVMGNEERLAKEMEMVRGCNRPILGICFGFELIARSYGSTLKEMKQKEKGLIAIVKKKDDELLKDIPGFQVFENHSWAIDGIGAELSVIAASDDGAEIIRHESKLIYGLQFHPEMLMEKSCGDEIFYNFIRIAKQKKTS